MTNLFSRTNFNRKKKFENLFLEFNKALIMFAYRYIEDISICEDIVQNTFVNLWNDDIFLKPKISLKAYLYKVVKNKCLNHIRSEKSKNRAYDNFMSFLSDSVIEHSMMKEGLYSRIHNVIKELPEKQQKVILMSMNSYSNLEISEEMNISTNTTRSHKRRAYEKLRYDLKKYIN